jgi:hypothetical protein
MVFAESSWIRRYRWPKSHCQSSASSSDGRFESASWPTKLRLPAPSSSCTLVLAPPVRLEEAPRLTRCAAAFISFWLASLLSLSLSLLSRQRRTRLCHRELRRYVASLSPRHFPIARAQSFAMSRSTSSNHLQPHSS